MRWTGATGAPTPLPLLLLLTVAAAGCLQGTAPPETGGGPIPKAQAPALWTPDPCDPSGAEALSGNAPWLAPFHAEGEDLVRTFARALGENLPDKERTFSDGSVREWRSDDVVFKLSHRHPDQRPILKYATPKQWPGTSAEQAEQNFRDFLDGFGVPDHVQVAFFSNDRGTSHSFSQKWGLGAGGPPGGGSAIVGDGSGEMGRWSSLEVDPLYDVRAAQATLPKEEAVATARAFMRCVLDGEGKTAEAGYTLDDTRGPGLTVAFESLTYRVHLAYDEPPPVGHCDGFTRFVHVDAVTDAVAWWGEVGCD